MKKIKTHVLMISRVFPTTHPKKGKDTFFVGRIKNAFSVSETDVTFDTIIEGEKVTVVYQTKIHTIRANYDLWEKRINEVNEGNAVLSIRYWTGKPYHSKQKEVLQLTTCSVQEVKFELFKESLIPLIGGDATRTTCIKIAQNDGLSLHDFKDWFKDYDLSKPMAIIHFTAFRY